MPSQAKAYIALVIAAGTLLSLLAAGSWSSVNLRPFAIYLGLAALASALKVRIPGMEGTISPNFVFLLLGMVALQFSQVAVISLAAALVQSLWASAKRPRLLQVAFSAAALVLSSALANKFAHLVLAGSSTDSAVVCVILAGSIYFPVNSGLVSGAYAPSMLWKGALVLLPATVLAYLYFANLNARVASAAMPVSVSQEEEYAEVRS